MEKSNDQVNQNDNKFRFDILGLTLSIYCAIFLIMDYCNLGIVSVDTIINLILCAMSFYAIRKGKEENKKIFTKTNTTITIITIILFAIKFIEMVVLYEDSYPAIHIYNTISLILVISLIYIILFAYICRYVGLNKDVTTGYAWGYCLGIIGLIILCGLDNKKKENVENNINTKYDDIDRLQKLKDNGAIDEKEFEIEKQKILTDDSEKNTKKINVKKIKIKRWQIIVAAIVIVSVVIIWNKSMTATIPNLVGMTVQEAQETMDKLGIGNKLRISSLGSKIEVIEKQAGITRKSEEK